MSLISKSILYKQKIETPQVNTNNIFVEGNGSLTFTDSANGNGSLIVTDSVNGTVFDTENPMASGYYYTEGIPSVFNNGVCYDIGEISDTTNLKNITFSANGRLIQTCELWFTTPAPAPINHQWPDNTYWIDSATGAAPILLPSKNYRIVFRQEPKKIIASIAYMY